MTQDRARAATHRAREQQASRYELLFEAAPLPYLVTDRQGVITAANAAAERLLAAEAGSLRGKPLLTFVDPERRRAFRRDVLALVRNREALDVKVRLRRHDAVEFDARARTSAVGDEILWSLVDETTLAPAEPRVSELNRELEEHAAARSAELESLVEQLPIGVALLRDDGKIEHINDRAAAIVGTDLERARDGLWSFTLLDLSGRQLEPDQYPVRRALAGEVVHDERVVVERADGERVVIAVSAVPVSAPARGALLVVDDVTELERRVRAEREFVSNAAHQIRTPITIIASVVAALRAGGQDDPQTLRRFIDHIDDAVARLAGLAEALLALARLQSGESTPLRVVALRPLLDRAAGRRTITVDCPADAAVVADEALLVEAISNVVDNAFVHGGGDVELRARRKGTTAVVEVRDRGPGIPSGRRESAFERFSGSGTGLGLAIASEAARALGGSLELDDIEGGGLLVRFKLRGAKLL